MLEALEVLEALEDKQRKNEDFTLVEDLSIILVPKSSILVVIDIIWIGCAELLGFRKFVGGHRSVFGNADGKNAFLPFSERLLLENQGSKAVHFIVSAFQFRIGSCNSNS